MGFNPGNMNKMMKQVQKMQREMARVQEELAQAEVEGTAGGGMVRATFDGHGQIRALSIAREAVDPDDVEMLQDLVLAAIRDGQAKVQQLAQEKMSAVTGGMSLPGGWL